jgi:transcription-repair coupling factor (superfamily II helicase)
LRRLSRGAKYKEDLRQLVVPLPKRADPAEHLVGFLRDLVPVGETSLATADGGRA